jgi:DNA-binding transcriptional ArsR family regulator
VPEDLRAEQRAVFAIADDPQAQRMRALKVLREGGLVDVHRRGIWAYYHVLPDASRSLSAG